MCPLCYIAGFAAIVIAWKKKIFDKPIMKVKKLIHKWAGSDK